MAVSTRTVPAGGNRLEGGTTSIDTTDWLDWDHWQGVEEYQDIVDGLGEPPLDEFTDGDAADGAACRQLHRRLYRRGIVLED